MGIKTLVTKTAGKAADAVSKLSTLSPAQLEEIENKREQYLIEKPDPSDDEAIELTRNLLAVCGVEIFNAYLPQIRLLYTPVSVRAEYGEKGFDANHNLRYFDITKWVTDKKENNLEKLVNVYAVLSRAECNIALIFHRTCEKTRVYLAVTNTANAPDSIEVENYKERLADAIKGNFPGAEIEFTQKTGTLPCFEEGKTFSVASASNIPTEKSEKFASQTIEKLLDGNIPSDRKKEYILILMATPILDVEERKLHLSDLYSALAPYEGWSTQFTYDEHSQIGSSATAGLNIGASFGLQKGASQSISETDSASISEGSGRTNQTGTTDSTNESRAKTKGWNKSKSHAEGTSESTSVGVNGGIKLGEVVEVGGNAGKTTGSNMTDTIASGTSGSDTLTKGISKAKSVSEAFSKTITNTAGHAIGKTSGAFNSISQGINFGANFARSSNISATLGKSESITQNYTNFNIKHALELLEEQMKRYEKSTALGMWDFAAYVLSEDFNVANNVAHSYLALTQGEESYMSQSAINLWRGDMNEYSEEAREICKYLKELRHPVFGLDPNVIDKDPEWNVYPAVITATTSLSGKELAYSLNFPQKSIAGLPVIECAEFGRNIASYDPLLNDGEIHLGRIFHMNHEERTKVDLSTTSLTSHTFITGSTGAGKSNTIYKILNGARDKGIKFLVIEPAKGEYKNVFGMQEDVYVLGTNPKVMPLLKINPFSFPDTVHVLEHIDRLVEIFNVCWPMYAAMPAVLKNAVEKSYEDCGWDLIRSTNEFGNDLYPSFTDVAHNVKAIIESSEYDAENKGAYKGSLLTRLSSLTNGINGLVFNSDEIKPADLFDRNVIVDLSRVGSSETKSLIMGMLILKLQEYRMNDSSVMNAELSHLTVLEEAHNILKRTSAEQISESSNLIGKSVEMISNSIAEMRTYGEGFIIADQSPGLLDMAAIRNTNTKIIMRLPDESDRELVGRAANLNDDQITELAKLPRGVAAIYQNEWIQPVLCKVDHVSINNEPFEYKPNIDERESVSAEDRMSIAELLSKGTTLDTETNRSDIRNKLIAMQMDASLQVSIMRLLNNPPAEPRMTKLAPIMKALLPEVYEAVRNAYTETSIASVWTECAESALRALIPYEPDNQVRRDIVQSIMTYYLVLELNAEGKFREWAMGGNLK